MAKWVLTVVLVVCLLGAGGWALSILMLMQYKASHQAPSPTPSSGVISFGANGSGCALEGTDRVFLREDRVHRLAEFLSVRRARMADIDVTKDGEHLPGFPNQRTLAANWGCVQDVLPVLDPGDYVVTFTLEGQPSSTASFRVGR